MGICFFSQTRATEVSSLHLSKTRPILSCPAFAFSTQLLFSLTTQKSWLLGVLSLHHFLLAVQQLSQSRKGTPPFNKYSFSTKHASGHRRTWDTFGISATSWERWVENGIIQHNVKYYHARVRKLRQKEQGSGSGRGKGDTPLIGVEGKTPKPSNKPQK